MIKRVIQIPVDEKLLKELDVACKKQRKPRSEVIRQACREYLKETERKEQERLYMQGYLRIPEIPDAGQAQMALVPQILEQESW